MMAGSKAVLKFESHFLFRFVSIWLFGKPVEKENQEYDNFKCFTEEQLQACAEAYRKEGYDF
jgi:hypothetical protein